MVASAYGFHNQSLAIGAIRMWSHHEPRSGLAPVKAANSTHRKCLDRGISGMNLNDEKP
ncbi:MAG: hypothetical protein HC865_04665 [Cyanobacteria bacterium RU_5_0]|nr:hypothetical protein [Cyanobacteria bacterium RU_5_0]